MIPNNSGWKAHHPKILRVICGWYICKSNWSRNHIIWSYVYPVCGGQVSGHLEGIIIGIATNHRNRNAIRQWLTDGKNGMDWGCIQTHRQHQCSSKNRQKRQSRLWQNTGLAFFIHNVCVMLARHKCRLTVIIRPLVRISNLIFLAISFCNPLIVGHSILWYTNHQSYIQIDESFMNSTISSKTFNEPRRPHPPVLRWSNHCGGHSFVASIGRWFSWHRPATHDLRAGWSIRWS